MNAPIGILQLSSVQFMCSEAGVTARPKFGDFGSYFTALAQNMASSEFSVKTVTTSFDQAIQISLIDWIFYRPLCFSCFLAMLSITQAQKWS